MFFKVLLPFGSHFNLRESQLSRFVSVLPRAHFLLSEFKTTNFRYVVNTIKVKGAKSTELL